MLDFSQISELVEQYLKNWDLEIAFTEFNLNQIRNIVAISVPIISYVWWIRKVRRKRKIPSDTQPFKVFAPKTNISPGFFDLNYGDTETTNRDPSAGCMTTYKFRKSNKNIKQELFELLEEGKWILILGPTGIGKTREAAEVAQMFNDRGWTVLYLRSWLWLDSPTEKQLAEIGQAKKLLFVLDDLNRKMFYGDTAQSPKAEDSPTEKLNKPLQERLLAALSRYDKNFDEVLVIATARNEHISKKENQPSQWQMLQWDKYPNFWNRFTQYKLEEQDRTFANPDLNNAFTLAPGTYTLECDGIYKRGKQFFLNGITDDGRVNLVSEVEGHSGTIWQISFDEADRIYWLECQGNKEGARFLNGIPSEKKVNLLNYIKDKRVGIKWKVESVSDDLKTFKFICCSSQEEPHYLNGDTTNDNDKVNLVDLNNNSRSGTRWKVKVVESVSDNPEQ